MRWRTLEEVKAGKGESICANISCGRTESLKVMEVIFSYPEEGRRKDVLVKCVLCEKCGRKMRRARGKDESKRKSKSGDVSAGINKHRHHADQAEISSEKSNRRQGHHSVEPSDDSENHLREHSLSDHRKRPRSRSPNRKRERHGTSHRGTKRHHHDHE